jgi:hypothetical protein
MGWSSIDNLVNDITVNGKYYKLPFVRTVVTGATSAAGRWHEALSGVGTGGPMTLTGSAGAGVALTNATAGALPINAAVASDIRRLLSMLAASSSATIAPATIILTDLLHVYRSCVLTGTPSTMSAHPTWTGTGDTRMTSAVGVQCSLIVTTAGTAGSGSLTPTYNDSGGSSSTGGVMYAVSTTAPAGSLYAGGAPAVGLGGPFMALAAGDVGVQSIQSYTIGTGLTSGVGAFMLHRPICMIPLAAANLAGERDFLSGIPALPRIYDDACLGLLVLVGGAFAANGTVCGEINFAWGA